MRQLGIALHNYHDRVGSFPTSFWRNTRDSAASTAVDGTNRHSWFAMILPNIEQAAVYNAMNFSVAVGGAINSTAALTAINSLMCPSDPGPSQSTIARVDNGVGTNSNSGPKLSYLGNFGDNYNDDNTVNPFPNLPFYRDNGFGEYNTQRGSCAARRDRLDA